MIRIAFNLVNILSQNFTVQHIYLYDFEGVRWTVNNKKSVLEKKNVRNAKSRVIVNTLCECMPFCVQWLHQAELVQR